MSRPTSISGYRRRRRICGPAARAIPPRSRRRIQGRGRVRRLRGFRPPDGVPSSARLSYISMDEPSQSFHSTRRASLRRSPMQMNIIHRVALVGLGVSGEQLRGVVRGEPGQVCARHPGELGARKRERADVADLVDDDQRARILRVEPVDGVFPVGNGPAC